MVIMRYVLLFLLLLTNLGSGEVAAASGLFKQEPNPSTAADGQSQSSPLQAAQQHGGFLPVDKAFKLYAWREQGKAWIGFKIHPGYYLYKGRLHLTASNGDERLGQPELPPGSPKNDRYMGQVRVYHHQLVFAAPITRAPSDNLKVTLDYQGCAEKGLCYAPEQRELTLTPGSRPAELAPPQQDNGAQAEDDTHDHTASQAVPVAGQHQVSPWQLGLLFLAGIGLVFTPCVLPMLPIVSALVVGQTASSRRALWLSSCYVFGMIVIYTALGLLLGLLGSSLNLQARMQSPWIVIPFAVLFVVLALFTKEWLRLPSLGTGSKLTQLEERFRQMGPLGLTVAGGLSTLIVSPCLSAPLAGVLGYISTTGNAVGGALSLLALGLGMGIPLILVCVFGSGVLPKRGAWMERVRSLCALALLAVALWLVSAWLPGSLVLALDAFLIMAAALYLGLLQGSTPVLLRAFALSALVWGLCCMVGAALGHHNPFAPLKGEATLHTPAQDSPSTVSRVPQFKRVTSLAQLDQAVATAASHNRAVMVDVYADWCVACKDMEASVFPQPAIAQALQHFTLIRYDVTKNSRDSRALLERYGLYGPPTLLFFNNGQELPASRLQGEPSSEQLKTVLERLSS